MASQQTAHAGRKRRPYHDRAAGLGSSRIQLQESLNICYRIRRRHHMGTSGNSFLGQPCVAAGGKAQHHNVRFRNGTRFQHCHVDLKLLDHAPQLPEPPPTQYQALDTRRHGQMSRNPPTDRARAYHRDRGHDLAEAGTRQFTPATSTWWDTAAPAYSQDQGHRATDSNGDQCPS